MTSDDLARLLGYSTFVGLAVLVVAIPINYLIGLQSIKVSPSSASLSM